MGQVSQKQKLSEDLCANDLFKKCYQKKPVREWEQQEGKGEEARQTCNLRQLDPTAELWVKVMLQLCQATRELGLTYSSAADQGLPPGDVNSQAKPPVAQGLS